MYGSITILLPKNHIQLCMYCLAPAETSMQIHCVLILSIVFSLILLDNDQIIQNDNQT